MSERLTAPLTRSFSLRSVFGRRRKSVEALLAMLVAASILLVPPPAPLSDNAMYFLAALAAALILWVFETFDEYLVALMLLLWMLLFDIVPPKIALSGFSAGSWFFVLGALGIGAAITSCGLPSRLARVVLRYIPLNRFRSLSFVVSTFGLFLTALLPTGKVRSALMSPVTSGISQVFEFQPRSNGAAVLALSAYVGFGQMSFMFLTGGAQNLVGWSLLPESAKSDFGWFTWVLLMLPAGLFTFIVLFGAARFFFPLAPDDVARVRSSRAEAATAAGEPLSKAEWLSLAILAGALVGWLGKPLHGIGEAWIAMMALVAFLLAGVMDKNALRNKIDWGFLLFFGAVYSLAAISSELKIDRWLLDLAAPLLAKVSFHPTTFLMAVILLVYVLNLFMKKVPAVVLLMLTLIPWARDLGIHPGVLLVTIAMAIQGFLLPYQDAAYQLTYASFQGKAFSHGQARKVLAVKMLVSFAAVALSVPYWSYLGFIHSPVPEARARVLEQHAVESALLPSVLASPVQPGPRTMPDPSGPIAPIQARLAELGYEPGPVDGILGPRTRRAIRVFQRQTGLKVDGKPSPELMAALKTNREE